MTKNSEIELQQINIQIGCVLRLARLRNEFSQLILSGLIPLDSTMIGRIERAENFSSWEKIYILSKFFDIDFNDLIKLKTRVELLDIVEQSLELEKKLTDKKREYYAQLEKKIKSLFI